MLEREYIEHYSWDTRSIVDVAIDASVDILRLQGNVDFNSAYRIGQGFGSMRKGPFDNLTIVAPDSKTPLITFFPPLEYAVNKQDLEQSELSAEARLVVFNPLAQTPAPDYQKIQRENILTVCLRELSPYYRLKQQELVLTFPSETFAKKVEYHVIPILQGATS